VIQGPAFHQIEDNANDVTAARHEKNFALAGMVLCIVAFVAYLFYQVKFVDNSDKVERVQLDAIHKKLISLSGAFADELATVLEMSVRI
jgi:uncharacterized membrane protein affecting hemolysin expression